MLLSFANKVLQFSYNPWRFRAVRVLPRVSRPGGHHDCTTTRHCAFQHVVGVAGWNIRRKSLLMGEVQGQGYIGQALGIADVLATSYFHALEYRPEDPEWEGRDRFLLSIGHYAIALYAALMEAGVLPENELETYGMDDSRMPMSGMASYTPGMEITGGSLGHGLGIAVGMALGLKRKKNPAFVYNLMSDGELGEGSTSGSGDVGYAMGARQPHLHRRLQQPTGRWAHPRRAGRGRRGPQVGGVRLARAGGGRQRPRCAGRGVRHRARTQAAQAARHHLQHHHVQGRQFLEARESNHFVRVEADEWSKALTVLEEGKPQ